MKKFAVAAFALTALASCQTATEMEANSASALNGSYVGYPLYDYISKNGVVPSDAFDMPGGRRVFIFGAPCFSWWHTKHIGTGRSPANFIVERIEVRGYCSVGKAA